MEADGVVLHNGDVCLGCGCFARSSGGCGCGYVRGVSFVLFIVSLLLPAVQCLVPSLTTVRAFGGSVVFLIAFGNVMSSSVAIGAFFVVAIGSRFAGFGPGAGKKCGPTATRF